MAQSPLLFLFLELFTKEGGIQTYIKDIFQEYAQLSGAPEADIFLLRDKPTSANPFETNAFRFHYFHAPTPTFGRLWFSAALLWYVAVHRPQRVLCGHIKLAPLTRLICQRFKIPYTVITYGKEVWNPLAEGDRTALAQADSIWTISRYTRDRTCESNHLDPAKFQMVPCAFQEDVFTPGETSAELMQIYQLYDAKVLLTVARLWSGDIYKGVDVTIRALPKILTAYPDVKYLVVGRGDDQPRLAKLAEDLGVGDRVIFAGFVPTDQLVDHYRLADGYVMPSQEGFGIVYLEAMACGVPVIAGDDDGSADPLQDGRVGWQVPHRDPDAVAQACIELLSGTDPRCNSTWLREQALGGFGRSAFRQILSTLLVDETMGIELR